MDKSRYTEFHDKCGEIERRFGRQGKLPLKPLDLSVITAESLLDFGAGKGLHADKCKWYYTVDADENLKPTYTSLGAAKADLSRIDAIIANQVFEHLILDEIDDAVSYMHALLKPEGMLLATIPNVHRGTYYFNDIDHKTPLMYYHLAAFFEINGLRVVDAYRYAKNHHLIANASPEMKQFMDFMETMYELDPAQFIAVVATR